MDKEEVEHVGSMRFEDLLTWQESRILVKQIYDLTKSKEILRDFGLVDQMRRASVSIMTNIAEGFERKYIKEKLQFYNIAKASSGELRSLLYVVADSFEDLDPKRAIVYEQLLKVARLLTGLINSTLKRLSK